MLVDDDFQNINLYSITRLKSLMKKYNYILNGLKKHIFSIQCNGERKQLFTNEEYNLLIKERNNRCIAEHGELINDRDVLTPMLNTLFDEYYEYVIDKHKNAKKLLIEKEQNNIFNCECGITVNNKNRIRHLMTKKHLDFVNGIEPVETQKLYNCECGSNDIWFIQKKRHEKTKKHLDFINGVEPVENSKYYNCEICNIKLLKSNKWNHLETKKHKDKIILCVETNELD
jgi:hypothetical protein